MTDQRAARPWWTRREFMKSSAAAAAGMYAMRWANGLAADIPNEFDGSKFQLAAAEPNPKHGGVLRVGMPLRPPHFDVHQSGTIFNLGSQGVMFDNLIRRDPRDGGQTIIPDLAHSWEIAKDGKTYTFHLRQGVQFHDGMDFTSADIKATFDRIAKPPTGINIPRTPLFSTVSEIVAVDPHRIEFRLSEPRPSPGRMRSTAVATYVQRRTGSSSASSMETQAVADRDCVPHDCASTVFPNPTGASRSVRADASYPSRMRNRRWRRTSSDRPRGGSSFVSIKGGGSLPARLMV